MGVYFSLLGVAFAALAVELGGWGWLWSWPAFAFGAVGVAYFVDAPGVFGKRADGSLRPLHVLALLPYQMFSWVLYWRTRVQRRHDPFNEVAPGIYVGRRPSGDELPPDVAVVVDLTAELPVDRRVRHGRRYIALPTLDATGPRTGAFRALLDDLAAETAPVYIHCAAGRGRSATVAAALLVRRGLASDIGGAVRLMRRHRPGVFLRRAQRRRAEEALGGQA